MTWLELKENERQWVAQVERNCTWTMRDKGRDYRGRRRSECRTTSPSAPSSFPFHIPPSLQWKQGPARTCSGSHDLSGVTLSWSDDHPLQQRQGRRLDWFRHFVTSSDREAQHEQRITQDGRMVHLWQGVVYTPRFLSRIKLNP